MTQAKPLPVAPHPSKLGASCALLALAIVACHRDSHTSAADPDAAARDGGSGNAEAGARSDASPPSNARDDGGPSTDDGGSSTVDGGSSGDAAAGDAAVGNVVLGGPGCGFDAAAFCDTFDAPAAVKGRAGELDARHWSGAHLAAQFPSGNGNAIGIGSGPLPAGCRAGLPAQVFPDQDALICDPNASLASNHLLVVAAAQNYGQNSYRIRQPFDFANRTGHVVFDAEAVAKALLGWVSLEITEDPINAPSFAFGHNINNDEGSLIPRSAVELQFQNSCDGYVTDSSVSLRSIAIYKDYALTQLSADTPTCVPTATGKLNHFELAISTKRIEVRGTPFSADGKTFGAPVLIYGADVDLPFSRGYVSITTHNHATLKYSDQKVVAWTARWDNVGFDGPVVTNTREYEAPDSLTTGTDAWNRPGPTVSVGYRVPADVANPVALSFADVDPSGASSAVMSLSMWYLISGGTPSTYGLRHRWNGGPWHDRLLDTSEVGLLTGPQSQGQLGQIVDVPVSELRSGINRVEIVTVGAPQNYPPVAANVDLVLHTTN